MPVRPIVRLGHPALRTAAEALDPQRVHDDDVQALIDDLIDTMHDANGVGLAAPQIGIGLQLFIWRAITARTDPEAVPEAPVRTVINPMLEPLSGALVTDWEGCLSIPDLRGLVPRRPAVRLHGLDRRGEPMALTLEDYEARIVQHEYDHLNGIVFLDRMPDLRSLAFRDEWQAYLTVADDAPGPDPTVG
ncbi:MAG: peptide deformylase [Acidobacteriota bacterium]